MKKFTETLALILVCALILALFSGCTGPATDPEALNTEAPESTPASETPGGIVETEAPEASDEPAETVGPGDTDVPEVTEAPADTDEPAVTEEPTVTASPSNDFAWIEVGTDTPVSVDFDFDGSDDSIVITEERIDDWTSDYTVCITPASHPEAAASFKIDDAYWINSCLLNPDPESGIMYLVCSCGWGSDDTISRIYHADPGSGKIIEFSTELTLNQYADGEMLRDGLVLFDSRTEILGTGYLTARYSLTTTGPAVEDGYLYYDSLFADMDEGPAGEYPFTEDDEGVKVLKKIGVSLIDESGERTEGYDLKKGERVWPVYTDGEHFVVCSLKDGRLVQINFFIPDGGYVPYMNGAVQDEYFDVFYFD